MSSYTREEAVQRLKKAIVGIEKYKLMKEVALDASYGYLQQRNDFLEYFKNQLETFTPDTLHFVQIDVLAECIYILPFNWTNGYITKFQLKRWLVDSEYTTITLGNDACSLLTFNETLPTNNHEATALHCGTYGTDTDIYGLSMVFGSYMSHACAYPGLTQRQVFTFLEFFQPNANNIKHIFYIAPF